MEDEILYRPRELYEKQFKQSYHENAEKHFEELTKEAKIDIEANKKHVTQYKKDEAASKEANSKAGSARGLGTFVLVCIIIFMAIGGLMILFGALSHAEWYIYLIGAFLLASGIGLIVVRAVVVKKLIERREQLAQELAKRTQNSLSVCYNDMAELNRSFDWNAPAAIMEKTTPIIDLDPYFTPERFCYLRDKFGLQEVTDPHETVLGVISGQIQGNPFIIERILTEHMAPKVYTGSIVITWTTTYRDEKGTHTQTHTQTLTASISRPAPYYRTDTRLIYGNEAAPHLHFSRVPSGASNMSEKERDKAAASGMKELKKLSDKQLTSGAAHVLTPMGNDHFDVFFGANDRDNEVEFRLLFTPLAQKNMLDILENPTPFGDDFVMVKDGMVNSIASAHSQSFDYDADPARFMGYDWEDMKAEFVSYCDFYIQGLFFDLAPLLSIPLYQMHKPHEYIYDGGYGANITAFEHEVMANSMDPDVLRPEGAASDLPLINKQLACATKGESDCVVLSTYSYHETPQVEFVTQMGGDGRLHEIPVHWIQYDKVQRESSIAVRKVGGSRKDFKDRKATSSVSVLKRPGLTYRRGLLAFLIDDDVFTQEEENELASLFSSAKTGDNETNHS